jgi:AraC-like DNA-binding protein
MKRYPITKGMFQLTVHLGIDGARTMRRAGFASDFLTYAEQGVTAPEFFTIIQALFDEAGDPAFAITLGKAFAQAPVLPAILAFSSSPNTEIGLTRLALFKPLVAPIRLDISRSGEALRVTISSSDPNTEMPADISAFELVYFLECTRKFTAHAVTPLRVELPPGSYCPRTLASYFGQPVMAGDMAALTLSLKDAHRPLISHDDSFWAMLEPDLRQQLKAQDAKGTTSLRVQNALVELLPSGEASVGAVSARLGMSARSLQRRLSTEGESFQRVLDSTRAELSLKYLAMAEMSVAEISYLLAYRDPNSFYRAFQTWTGMTPAQARFRS